ncbi:hypothetical protein DJ39_697 [Yersinia ruckeri ATCC 29473]|uniref:Uncharacterized protein n=1 Tax=Yersinia ruckeri TaxID=29486 RepID=A0A380QMT8_YERRU|nr:hypothetical protein QMA0440_02673 [Yersinia ruckeri]KGA49615.1 hypothetical protein DJ39_697 [Yersinia ruckeri ATCC 29473]KFE38367.1 hypothetical protein nADLYRO1b_2175 [Yersinia ruckeri]QTD75806.1 Uncharacterized protein YR821_0875 [Yersinia ruckeri]SUP96680.1 Uncharacterised protein [Yersinia ruckeri]
MSARENLRRRRSLDKNTGSAVVKMVLSLVKKQTAPEAVRLFRYY